MIAHSGQWIQTRRRLDWMLGPLCVLVAFAAVMAYQFTGRWSAFASVALACGIWLWFRRTVPAGGRPYSSARTRFEHAYMLFTLGVAVPTFLAVLAVDFLGIQPSAWIFFGITAAFFAAMIGGSNWFERRLRRQAEIETANTAFEPPAI